MGPPTQTAPAPIELSLATNDLVYDPIRQRIYASIPGSAASNGNTLTQIDPITATIGTSTFIGNEPTKLAISADSQYIYAALEGETSIRKFDAASQTAGLQFSLGNSSMFGAYSAYDLAVLPGSMHDFVAVSRRTTAFGERREGVAVYQNGVALPKIATGSEADRPKGIVFKSTTHSLYGLAPNGALSAIVAEHTGAILDFVTPNLFSNGEADISNDEDLLYSTRGEVVDPYRRVLVGAYPGVGSDGVVLSNAATNRVYFVIPSGPSNPTTKVLEFNRLTFVQTGFLELPSATGLPRSLIKWGSNGLAFRTTGNQVFLLTTSMILPVTATPLPSPVQVANGVIQLPMVTNDLVFDSTSGKIFASVPSAAGTYGNSIASISQTGVVDNPVSIGSEPSKLAISDDNHFIYVGLNGTNSIRKFDAPTRTPGIQFPIGSQPMWAEDIAVLPGNPNAIAVSRSGPNISMSPLGVAVYDEGVQRPQTSEPGGAGVSNLIEFSSNSSRLYGYHNRTTGFNLSKMNIDSSGVSVVSEQSYLIHGFGTDIRYGRDGRLYATNGRVIDPEAGLLVGMFPDAAGLITNLTVPDIDAGRIYFLSGGLHFPVVLKVFDANTFIQTGTFTINGVAGMPGSLIKTGPNGLAFRTETHVYFISLSAITQIPPTPVPTPTQVASGVTKLDLGANDLVYDPVTQRIYAALRSSAGTIGNSIAAINPMTGEVETPVFVGSEPNKLAISDDNQFIYANLDGGAAYIRFDIATRTTALRVPLKDEFGLTLSAEDIAVMPGSPHTVAVARRNLNFSPRHEGVVIFDNGVARNGMTPTHGGSNVVEFSTSPATLYGISNEFFGFAYYKMSVATGGVSVTAGGPGVSAPVFEDIKHDSGLLYTSSGVVVNPETGIILGTYLPGFYEGKTMAFVPDSKTGRIYFMNFQLGMNGAPPTTELRVYDLNTGNSWGALPIPGVTGAPIRMVRWGANGLAFATDRNELYIVQTSLVPAPTTNQITFSASNYTVSEGAGRVDLTVNRTNASGPASVVFRTSDHAGLNNCNLINAIASSRCDYAATVGTLNFASGETSKTVAVTLVDDSYAEGNESFFIALSVPSGGRLGTAALATITINDNESFGGPNPVDQTPFFVRQQYLDFLSREPDPGGYAGWQAVINNCPPGDTTCDRIHVSSAFYRSPEFLDRGYFIYRFYPMSFGRKPGYAEFMPDLARLSGFLSNDQLEAAKVALINDFMNRQSFAVEYDNTEDFQFVNRLIDRAQVTLPNRQALIDALNAGTMTRAQVFRTIADSPEVFNKYYNESFVVMQYFGYLRRDPDALYTDWITHLNATGDYRSMINGFMNSTEYRFRFGP